MPANHAYLRQRIKLTREVQRAAMSGDRKKEQAARAKLNAINLKIQGKKK